MKKELLYVDHYFHCKTKSAQFLEEILNSAYTVVTCFIDPCEDDLETVLSSFENQVFDVVVLFQIMPDIEKLKKKVRAKHFVFFPMFDGAGELADRFWEAYREFNIINFSRTLHERLLSLGLSSYYIQYFPEPVEPFEYGNSTNAFFWQRISELDVDMVERLLRKTPVKKICVHKVLDPFQEFREPVRNIIPIEYSEWYETRAEMLKRVESCGIYIAPRAYEGIGMSFLEAMAMGRCVIAPDHPTMNEYIIHGYNGLLYDFHLFRTIKIENVEEIQKNAFLYIKEGYAQWKQNKYKIIDWLEAPLQQNRILCCNGNSQYMNVKTYRLLGFIPFLTIKSMGYKRYYYLFDFLRIAKSKRKANQVVFYLFNIFPVWKIN